MVPPYLWRSRARLWQGKRGHSGSRNRARIARARASCHTRDAPRGVGARIAPPASAGAAVARARRAARRRRAAVDDRRRCCAARRQRRARARARGAARRHRVRGGPRRGVGGFVGRAAPQGARARGRAAARRRRRSARSKRRDEAARREALLRALLKSRDGDAAAARKMLENTLRRQTADPVSGLRPAELRAEHFEVGPAPPMPVRLLAAPESDNPSCRASASAQARSRPS